MRHTMPPAARLHAGRPTRQRTLVPTALSVRTIRTLKSTHCTTKNEQKVCREEGTDPVSSLPLPPKEGNPPPKLKQIRQTCQLLKCVPQKFCPKALRWWPPLLVSPPFRRSLALLEACSI